MIKLKDKIQAAYNFVKASKEERPEITDIWFQFNDCDLGALREIAEEYGVKLEFMESERKMRLQLNLGQVYCEAVIFCRSKELKVTTHTVIEDAVVNV